MNLSLNCYMTVLAVQSIILPGNKLKPLLQLLKGIASFWKFITKGVGLGSNYKIRRPLMFNMGRSVVLGGGGQKCVGGLCV